METYTQPADIIEQFRKRKRRQWLLSGLLILIAVIFLWADLVTRKEVGRQTDPILIGILIAIVIGIVLLSFRNWRCPACDKYLGRTRFPRFCPKCGAKFVEE